MSEPNPFAAWQRMRHDAAGRAYQDMARQLRAAHQRQAAAEEEDRLFLAGYGLTRLKPEEGPAALGARLGPVPAGRWNGASWQPVNAALFARRQP